MKAGINLFLARPIPLDWLLKLLHLNFVNLDDAKLDPFDGYFIFFVTPIFESTAVVESAIDFGLGNMCANQTLTLTTD